MAVGFFRTTATGKALGGEKNSAWNKDDDLNAKNRSISRCGLHETVVKAREWKDTHARLLRSTDWTVLVLL